LGTGNVPSVSRFPRFQVSGFRLKELERMARALECDVVYGLVPWHRSLEDRAMELVERELWRKRYTGRKTGTRE
jgi:hypothetical protein